uniref:superoxide dismutase n=1 Tax=Magnetococcus massalia (strain MO-1) TaxID=451514 RepID=A0A1S7LEN3_MAGMO|nr:Superoxide dismutase [Candidatus Magnetococcus massalia]
MREYTVHESLKPMGLEGISQEQIEDHWLLYKGYVTQSNLLLKELHQMRIDGLGNSAGYADRRRRFGFEYAGMTLHEYYFGNLKFGQTLHATSPLHKGMSEQLGSFEGWMADFIATGKTRGIGWAILYLDPATGQLINQFVQLHEDGNIPGFIPLLVMDVFEHAYMVDHHALGRPDYIKAFMHNIHWTMVEKRYIEALKGHELLRFAA